MDTNWTDIQINVLAQYIDDAQSVATSIATGGIYIEDYRDLEKDVLEIAHIDLIDEELLAKDRQNVIIHMYIAPTENVSEIMHVLNERMEASSVPYEVKTQGVNQQDWEKGWKAYYHPIEIGTRLAIVPSWEEYNSNRAKILLDPGMAFGTGTHETTALCLEILDEIINGGETVLDIGTGSGILGIAAIKLGANICKGVDIDPMCVKVANENALLNNVQNKFTAFKGDLSGEISDKYDIICANIVANAIMQLAPSVAPLLKHGGTFIASGIIDTRCDEVVNSIQKVGIKVEQIKHDGGWVALICKADK